MYYENMILLPVVPVPPSLVENAVNRGQKRRRTQRRRWISFQVTVPSFTVTTVAMMIMIVSGLRCELCCTEFLTICVAESKTDVSSNRQLHRRDQYRFVFFRTSLSSIHTGSRNRNVHTTGHNYRKDVVASHRQPYTVVRGGADYFNDDYFTPNNIESRRNNENRGKNNAGVGNAADDSNVTTTKDDTTLSKQYDINDIPNKGKSLISWLLGDLFLSDDNVIMTNATSDERTSSVMSSTTPSTPVVVHTAGTGSNVTQSTGRGGALVKHKMTFRNRFLPPWLQQPLVDIQRVVPFTARLFRDDTTDGSDTFIDYDIDHDSTTTSSVRTITDKIKAWSSNHNDDDDSQSASSTASTVTRRITESVVATATTVSKVWWVDTWADHLPDDDFVEDSSDDNRTVVHLDSHAKNEHLDIEYYDVAIVSKDNDRTELPSTDTSHVNISTTGNEVRMILNRTTNILDVPQQYNNSVSRNDDTSFSNEMLGPSHKKVNATKLAPSLNATVYSEYDLSPNENKKVNQTESLYISSGLWRTLDRVATLGYADTHPDWRMSSHFRTIRKTVANITGLHGFISGKPSPRKQQSNATDVEDPKMGLIRRRLAAIERARQNIERITMAQKTTQERKFPFWKRNKQDEDTASSKNEFRTQQSEKERTEERKRYRRIKEIDQLIQGAQKELMQLASEKDVLQHRPNPFWNYTTYESVDDISTNSSKNETVKEETTSITERSFNFPSPDLVDEYLEALFITGRLVRMNQTELWRQSNEDDDDDEDVDELSFTSMMPPQQHPHRRNNNNQNNAAPWLLRNIVGEKIGEAVETAAYKAVCTSLMTILAKGLSNMHGVNVMGYSDIRLYAEETPHLPPPLPADKSMGSNKNRNYAQQAFQDALRRGSTASSTKRRFPYHHRPPTFIQRDAIVETLTSQCQIAAPLLNLFPLSLQRALISNIVIMCTAIITDFFEGLEFHILGHRLTFLFQPITEEDMMKNMIRDDFGSHGYNSNSRTGSDRFEAAVRVTAEEVSENLNIFDRWHERALGSGVLRTQIATIIARLVLTLIDDILRASHMDLWSAHAGGPKLSAALEYRTVVPTNIFGL